MKRKDIVTSAVVDIIALAFIYFIPALSHAFSIPLYYADPMKIALFSVFVLTKKENVYFMAVTIPLLSFLISGHPVFPKCLLVSIELVINVLLIYHLIDFIKSKFALVFLSLFLSKTIYYLLKYVLIKMAVIDTALIATPIYIQVIVMVVLSTCLSLILNKKKIKQ